MPQRWKNPIGFFPTSVTLVLVVVYAAISAGLLYIHHSLPTPPKKSLYAGINVTEAWRDLQVLSGTYHPYNSHSNDVVRSWIQNRIQEILKRNSPGSAFDTETASRADASVLEPAQQAPAIVFDDLSSNITYFSRTSPQSVYFEGTNIIVYVRGSQDDDSDWWNQTDSRTPSTARGVLVNAHYDSVSTGYGATDDGVGVVSLLQLISHYTSEGNQPKRGLVALFNNGEEDFLNGAWAFRRHPISRFPDTFLNLEGAGAGGRAVLLRTTDAEVTRFYKKSPYPFGTSISADSFKRGYIRSETDYAVFNGELGLRGLDVAFYEPRARYHTAEDNSRDTSVSSIWHMLSAAVVTTKGLTSATNDEFSTDEGSVAVYFDVFGRAFGLMTLHTLIAISITLLVVAPVAIFAIAMILRKMDKSYLFAGKRETDPLDPHAPDETAIIRFGGWKGFSRYPIAFILATAAVIGLAFLVAKINPNIIYSSQYMVWSMMLLAWFLVSWFFLRGSDFMRPSALHRAHAFGWIFTLSWVLLLLATIVANNSKITGSYPILIYFAGAFTALMTCYLEFLALPSRKNYVLAATQPDAHSPPLTSGPHRPSTGSENAVEDRPDGDDPEPAETTSLLGRKSRASFKRTSRRRDSHEHDATEEHRAGKVQRRRIPFGDEQEWSGALPSGLWIVELLVFTPFALIFLGPIALSLSTGLHQTPADGNPVLPIYMNMALLTILLLVPASPFFHRMSSKLPTILLLVFVITILYNLLAFPFSPRNRLKVFFRQEVDLDTGSNNVTLTGLNRYVQKIIKDLPSAAGQPVHCDKPPLASRRGLRTCSWQGLQPNVVPESTESKTLGEYSKEPSPLPENPFESRMKVKAWRSESANETEAKIKISGVNTRACRLLFDYPIVDFYVNDAGPQDERVKPVASGGTKEIRLWSREWDRRWTVHVKWDVTSNGTDYDSKLTARSINGTAVCLWSDQNDNGVIPALDELQKYMPEWSIVTKLDDGLVLGSKRFIL